MIEIKQIQLLLPIKYFPKVVDFKIVFSYLIFIFLYDENKFKNVFLT